jgi:putative colanic acid biosynthesis glycosyltransferase
MAPLLAIVTVNRDDAQGLRATATSIAAQRRTDFEWLVIDGASRDASLAVIRANERLLTSWSSAPDRGVYDAMNLGLRRARSRYVMFLNSGDRLAGPDTVARIIAALQAGPEIDVLFAGTVLETPSGRRRYRPPRPPMRALRLGLPAYHQATVIRRHAHLRAPYDLALLVSADYGAIATLLKEGASAACLDHPIAIRSCGPHNLSERLTAQRFADFICVQRTVLKHAWPSIGVHLAWLAMVHLGYRLWRRPAWRAGTKGSSWHYFP